MGNRSDGGYCKVAAGCVKAQQHKAGPYKARLKQGEPRKRKKPGYRVTNARAYNQSLRKRGMINLYVPDGDLKAQFINAKSVPSACRGASRPTPPRTSS